MFKQESSIVVREPGDAKKAEYNHLLQELDKQVEVKDDIDLREQKIQLTFHNVKITAMPRKNMCGTIKKGEAEKVILNDVSGTIKPGEFVAILGASGAGKTTLLNYLSGRDVSTNLKKEGRIMVNGEDRDQKSFSNFTAFVSQDDFLFEMMTVRGNLLTS